MRPSLLNSNSVTLPDTVHLLSEAKSKIEKITKIMKNRLIFAILGQFSLYPVSQTRTPFRQRVGLPPGSRMPKKRKTLSGTTEIDNTSIGTHNILK